MLLVIDAIRMYIYTKLLDYRNKYDNTVNLVRQVIFNKNSAIVPTRLFVILYAFFSI